MGRNNTDFQGDEFNTQDVAVDHQSKHDDIPDGSGQPNTAYTRHYFTATHPKFGEIGTMQITELGNNHQIVGVNTTENFKRKGIATLLFRKALSVGLTPRHSSDRTEDGDAWAKSVGGYLPKNTLKKAKA
jgi:hypothetical protein